MRSLTTAALTDSNALNGTAWLIFLDIATTPASYYVRNNEDITWNSITYSKSDFDISAIPAQSSGELPEITIKLINTASLAAELESKYGYIGTGVTVYYVHYASRGPIAQADWPLRFSFKITNCVIKSGTVEFTLGVPNYLRQKFPVRKYRKDSCDFLYKGDYCWMKGRTAGSEGDTCDNSLANCIAHYNNQSSKPNGIPFGGFPSIGKGAYRYA